MSNISQSTRVPYYYQLYQILLRQIQEGIWKPDEILPTEAELQDRYDLSRSTVRQAMDMLVNDGLIYRQRGKGTFVAKPTINQNMNRIVSFWEDMQHRGFEPSTKVLSSEVIQASPDAAEILDIKSGDELASLVRLRLADGEPMSIEHTLLVHQYCSGVMQDDYANSSLRQMLEQKYNIRLTYARQKVRAVPASKTLADDLMVEQNSPLLYIERVSYSDQDIPIEFLRIYHRGDRYTFFTELRD